MLKANNGSCNDLSARHVSAFQLVQYIDIEHKIDVSIISSPVKMMLELDRGFRLSS